MTTIKATCPTCGEVALTPDDIELRVDDSATDGSLTTASPAPAAPQRSASPPTSELYASWSVAASLRCRWSPNPFASVSVTASTTTS